MNRIFSRKRQQIVFFILTQLFLPQIVSDAIKNFQAKNSPSTYLFFAITLKYYFANPNWCVTAPLCFLVEQTF